MKKVLPIIVLAIITLSIGAVGDSVAVNPYGGPCDLASENGWQNPLLNASCYSYIVAVDAGCADGSIPDWYCDSL